MTGSSLEARPDGANRRLLASTIFDVDDDPSVRKSLTRLVTSAGYAVEAFASAGDFLTREPFVRPCCAVLDVRLPGLTGLDLQETLARSGHVEQVAELVHLADRAGVIGPKFLRPGVRDPLHPD